MQPKTLEGADKLTGSLSLFCDKPAHKAGNEGDNEGGKQDHPGACPKCGMALEPKSVAAKAGGKDEGEDDSAELRDMSRRFWVGAALAVPVVVLAMLPMIPTPSQQSWLPGDTSPWIDFRYGSAQLLGRRTPR